MANLRPCFLGFSGFSGFFGHGWPFSATAFPFLANFGHGLCLFGHFRPRLLSFWPFSAMAGCAFWPRMFPLFGFLAFLAMAGQLRPWSFFFWLVSAMVFAFLANFGHGFLLFGHFRPWLAMLFWLFWFSWRLWPTSGLVHLPGARLPPSSMPGSLRPK